MDLVRQYWDADASGYDRAPGHGAHSAAERAAWTAVLARRLPAPPARVLDVGAGTGFLALPAARLGHHVTALDLSPEMLARLTAKAAAENLDIEVVSGDAHAPPEGPFDAVIERHVLWTLPDPSAALAAWRRAAPAGRLLLFESMWGRADPAEAVRQRLRELSRRLRRTPPAHHASYDPRILDVLPQFGHGTHPDAVVELVEASGWRAPTLLRLRDVEWTRLLAMHPAERLLGTTPAYLVAAA